MEYGMVPLLASCDRGNNVVIHREVPGPAIISTWDFFEIGCASQERSAGPRVVTAAGYSPCPIDRRCGARLCDASRALFFCVPRLGWRCNLRPTQAIGGDCAVMLWGSSGVASEAGFGLVSRCHAVLG